MPQVEIDVNRVKALKPSVNVFGGKPGILPIVVGDHWRFLVLSNPKFYKVLV